jgi:predicted transposase/invertase (TIGR01784 family)
MTEATINIQSKFLDPKNDVAFRKIFGTDKYKNVLIAFINDILEFTDKDAIIDVTFLPPNQEPDIASQKSSTVDVLCKDSTGIQYIVEMQVAHEEGFEKRALYYASKAYSKQLKKGDKEYWKLKKVIFIAITNYIVFPEKTHYKSDHVILDRDSYAHDLKDISFTFIELPKYKKDKSEKVSNRIESWCNYFKYADDTTEEESNAIVDPVLKEAYEAINQFNWTEEELARYETEIKREMDHIAQMESAANRGEAMGRIAKAIEIAKKMLLKGSSVEDIIDLTELTKEQIDEIK